VEKITKETEKVKPVKVVKENIVKKACKYDFFWGM
jgi:hypothetical protein